MAACNEADLRSPYPWFGGKSSVAPMVWERFGDVRNFVDPFLGSLAMLLGRPTPFQGTETVNDADGFVCNFWRALQADPEAVARFADHPVNENDLHARHAWLVGQRDDITRRLEGDPDWFDAKVAGWWAWGQSCWIADGWCSGKGPWQVQCDECLRKGGGDGPGVHRKLPNLGAGSAGLMLPSRDIRAWLQHLSGRIAKVRVCCGDWTRVMGPSVRANEGITAIFLDPPYEDSGLYAMQSGGVAAKVKAWAIANGDDSTLRIALCGYEGEHDMPDTWERVSWKSRLGYSYRPGGKGDTNARRERIWLSPNCLKPESERMPLFGNLKETA